jgi:hypothetical protein
MQKFDDQSYNPKYNAQRNLQGLTHYVDDATLRYHRSRILLTAINFDGLLFGLVESVSLDPNHTQRGFRAVVFDVFGTIIQRRGLEDCRKTRAAAEKDMRRTMQSVDALAHTLTAIEEQKRAYGRDLDAFARAITENRKAA